MFNRIVARIVTASLLVPIGLALGCDARSTTAPTPSPTTPTQPLPPASLFVTSVYPNRGAAEGGTSVTIKGFGFDSGATVTLDGAATTATFNNTGQIVVQTPAHAAGMVDIVVTNPNGQSARLARGFTYAVFTLMVSPNPVTRGSQLSVSWVAPGGSSWDWIALYKVDAPNTTYQQWWWEYTKGAPSGTFSLSAPAEPGEYELRYLLDDDFIDVARSNLVTVR